MELYLSELREAAGLSPRTAVRHVEIQADEQGQRLDNVVARLLAGVPRTRIFRLIRRGEVRVNGPPRRTGSAPGGRRFSTSCRRCVRPPRQQAARSVPSAGLIAALEKAVIYEDERLLVLDKPAGVAVHGGSGLSFGVIEALRASRPKQTLELAHRLDRDTSGVLMLAKRRSALRMLHALLREGQVQKSYLALLAGRWSLGHKKIDALLRTDLRVGGERRTVKVDAGGRNALTEFKLIEHYGARASLIEAMLHTGRNPSDSWCACSPLWPSGRRR